MPGETFQLTILLDADDDITGPQAPLAQAAQDQGVSGRLAALEMLLYPVARPGPKRPRRPREAPPQWPRRRGLAVWRPPVHRRPGRHGLCRGEFRGGRSPHLGGAELDGSDRLVRLGIRSGACRCASPR